MSNDGQHLNLEKIMKFTNNLKRKFRGASTTNLLTMFPALTVILCLLITGFFTTHSGVNDCRTGYEPSWCSEEGALNVNGEMDVYLPESTDPSSSKNLLEEVGENWTTNIMIVYVESEDYNITQKLILDELDQIERSINSNRNDRGEDDSIVYVLSISTVIKEVNSSAGRLAKAFFNGVADATGNEDLSDSANDTIDSQSDIIGNYAIPEEQGRIDRILEEMPQNALDKLVRDVGTFDAAGNQVNLSAKHWNRGVLIFGISGNLDKDGDGIDDDGGIPGIIERTQLIIDKISVDNNWQERNLTMTLTGPTPLTNAITEESFKLFWTVFPVGVVAVSLGLFLFHCDLLQTGRIRFVQGVKVVIITGLPTLCSVWITLGIIGFSDYEVTMTVIIVGPIVLALGVSYGLHITNRYAEAKGSPREKIDEALNSTGKAVFLSATTTIIGFISLVFTPMRPIQTVGWSLAGGIVVVYLMTMLMVPNLTLLLDLKKPSHPPPKLFTSAVEVPVNWTKISLSVFLLLMLISAGISRQNIEENIDLLDMAPEEIAAVQKMKVYSDEFDSGQPGFILVKAPIGAEPSFSFTAEHPYGNLEGIEELAAECDRIENTSAVSVVFLMKAIAVGVNFSGSPILDLLDEFPLPGPIDDAAELIFDREASGNASFWAALDTLDAQEDDGGRQIQNFLLYVFYNTLTDEMREFFISDDFDKNLIYIDMPFLDSQSTSKAVNLINLKTESAGKKEYSIDATNLIGVAPITIEINEMIVGSQWNSLFFALGFTVLTLALVFRDLRYALLTTVPVGFTVGMQWIVMDTNGVPLNLVTVMIGSILVGVGVDFSIHIANRVKELGGDLNAIKTACASTGMSLFEATTVTAAGMSCAFLIPIPAIKPFVAVIIVLLIIAALSALLLLPAIYSLFVKMNWGLTGGVENMVKAAGIRRAIVRDDIDVIDATLLFGNSEDAW
ncbi:MAG: MMPL family transporter [Euryarchaeota archaeon]|jgi:predicted RND superfamily exporter protein|nr:MMPL family transporter [Euryarchaeota archaeon]MBT7413371.1 MMPL family transporter [Euryarchaeota archaeon]